jgi:Na+-transporting NADH:ubiquinone oxidoreductase subunit B
MTSASMSDAFLGFIPGSIGETSVVACLLGAAYLIFAKIGSWRIMLSCWIGFLATTLLCNALSPGDGHYLSVGPAWQLVAGGFVFGSIFMATDPVSASQTNTGRWIYGFLIGALTVMVRVLNPAYPEGIMLAIIFMNVFAPTIDHFVTKANIKRREARLGVQ